MEPIICLRCEEALGEDGGEAHHCSRCLDAFCALHLADHDCPGDGEPP